MKLLESQKTVHFKRGLPKYIRKYIKQEKPKTLRDTLIRAKEAEELGKNHDEDEDIKSLQQSMTSLLEKMDKTSKPTTTINTTYKDMNKCAFCELPGHNMANCDNFFDVLHHQKAEATVNQLQVIADSKECEHCGIPGHTMQDCRKFKAAMQPQQRPQTTQPTSIKCYKCGAVGHREIQCGLTQPSNNKPPVPTCEYCHKTGHSRRECFLLNKTQPSQGRPPPQVTFQPTQQQPKWNYQMPTQQQGPTIGAIHTK